MSEPIAIIAAHPDDEVLGCGGTIARLVRLGHPVHILILADGESSRVNSVGELDAGRIEARNFATLRAGEILGVSSVDQLGFPDNRMDQLALLDIIKPIENFIAEHRPETVLTHHVGDVNIDHQIVHAAVIAACRPRPSFPVRELMFFEVPSSTEWRPPGSSHTFSPNWFVDISTSFSLKLEALNAYRDELREFPHPRSIEAIEALARWRGATVGVDVAEAFILGRKLF